MAVLEAPVEGLAAEVSADSAAEAVLEAAAPREDGKNECKQIY